jgi:hypothetical protein
MGKTGPSAATDGADLFFLSPEPVKNRHPCRFFIWKFVTDTVVLQDHQLPLRWSKIFFKPPNGVGPKAMSESVVDPVENL